MLVWNTSQIPEIIVREARKNKYLGEHFNILDRLVTSISKPFLHGVFKVKKLISAPLNPMDSFFLARGLRTLDVQMQRHVDNVMAVECMMEDHTMVVEVYYPGLDSQPDRYMSKSTFQPGRDFKEDREYMPQTYGEVDESNVFTRVPSPAQRLVVVLARDHNGYHPPVGLGHVFAILLEIPAGLER